MSDEFQDNWVGRRSYVHVTVIVNLDNLDSVRLCSQEMLDRSCLVFNLSHFFIFSPFLWDTHGSL